MAARPPQAAPSPVSARPKHLHLHHHHQQQQQQQQHQQSPRATPAPPTLQALHHQQPPQPPPPPPPALNCAHTPPPPHSHHRRKNQVPFAQQQQQQQQQAAPVPNPSSSGHGACFFLLPLTTDPLPPPPFSTAFPCTSSPPGACRAGRARVSPGAGDGEHPASDWFADPTQYKQMTDEMAVVSRNQAFAEELLAIEHWFTVLTEHEQSAAIYSLLRFATHMQLRFFCAVLQQMVSNDPVLAAELVANEPDVLSRWPAAVTASVAGPASALNSPVERPRSAMGGNLEVSGSAGPASVFSAGWNGMPLPAAAPAFAEHLGGSIERPKSAADADFNGGAYQSSTGPLVGGGNAAAPSRPFSAAPDGGARRVRQSPVTRPAPLNLRRNLYMDAADGAEERDRHLSSIFHPSGIKSAAAVTTFGRSVFDQEACYGDQPVAGRSASSPLASPITGNGGYVGQRNSAVASSCPASPSLPPGFFSSPLVASSSASPAWQAASTSAGGTSVPPQSAAAAVTRALPPAGNAKSKLANSTREEPDCASNAKESSAGTGATSLTRTSDPQPPRSNGMSGGRGGAGAGVIAEQNAVDDALLPAPPSPAVHTQLKRRSADIPGWLRSLRLHKYSSNFGSMTWQDLIRLDDGDLLRVGVVALGARRKMLRVFEGVRDALDVPVNRKVEGSG
ncbi:MAG: hypothetical protein BJ554DRAFT_5350 [Olpidium bornovanus]|uniref:SAM domain-containing protein n=1 Tax=Olpidium bornovanus TaxID=278681 RepID=A0A8H8A2H9_9FUNG|nr:MAG: hypothetical protein BJ554DRAFT_5350 [Olpidium bornovanus]